MNSPSCENFNLYKKQGLRLYRQHYVSSKQKAKFVHGNAENNSSKKSTNRYMEKNRKASLVERKKRLKRPPSLLLELADVRVDGLPLLQLLLALDEELHPVHHELHQLHLAEAQPVGVADVERAAGGSRVDSACAPLLQPHLLQDVSEQLVLAHVRDLDVHSGPHPRAQIAGAGQHEAEVVVPHVLVPGCLDVLLHLSNTFAPSVENLINVSTFLYGNDPQMVFLVYPNKEVLLVIVPYSSCVGPVSSHAASKQKR